ncbi:hypothetical protein MWU59_14160 [Flavobacteriaceae bacterium F08102]|nr:hypothetical protein [Flavobacteriaceae bacterium F08102]
MHNSCMPMYPSLGHLDLREIQTKGIKQTNKVMHLSAIAYNMKKYLKFTSKVVRSDAKSVTAVLTQIIDHLRGIVGRFNPSKKTELSSQ